MPLMMVPTKNHVHAAFHARVVSELLALLDANTHNTEHVASCVRVASSAKVGDCRNQSICKIEDTIKLATIRILDSTV